LQQFSLEPDWSDRFYYILWHCIALNNSANTLFLFVPICDCWVQFHYWEIHSWLWSESRFCHVFIFHCLYARSVLHNINSDTGMFYLLHPHPQTSTQRFVYKVCLCWVMVLVWYTWCCYYVFYLSVHVFLLRPWQNWMLLQYKLYVMAENEDWTNAGVRILSILTSKLMFLIQVFWILHPTFIFCKFIERKSQMFLFW
jgi:hypothetical protein